MPNSSPVLSALACGLLALLPLPISGDDTDQKFEILRRHGSKLTSDYSLQDALDPKELRSLASKTKLSNDEARRLSLLILHAGINKDAGFRDLLKKDSLRKNNNIDLALCAYDYALNGANDALDHILAQLATEDIGADVDTIVALSTLDEWDRTIRAFRKHFIYTDGAGGSCMAGFKMTRAYLYPKKYLAMRDAIEAPIKWPGPLLPKGK